METTDLISETIDQLAFSRILYKWNHTVSIVFGLTSFTQHNHFRIHSCCCMYQSSFLFYCGVVIPLHRYIDTIHLLFTTVHLVISSFSLLQVKLPVFVWSKFSFILNKYLGVECLDHVVHIFVTFEENIKFIIIFYIPPVMYERSSFSISSSTLEMISLFNFSHSTRFIVIFHWDFSI